MTLEDIYQFEKHLEDGFETVLTGAVANIYKSYETGDRISPRVEIKAFCDSSLNRQKVFADGTQLDNAFEGRLEMTVTTNRMVGSHHALLGAIRARMSVRYLNLNDEFDNEALAIEGIHQRETLDSFEDEDNVDITVLSYYVVFSIKDSAWPT
jgi:hypothetical protein